MRITSIDRPPRKRRYEVRIDHVLVLPLSPEVLAQANIHTGEELSDAQLHSLERTEARHSALATAMRSLAYGPHSEREIRTILTRKRVPADAVTETIARLSELRLLNDADFAKSYVEQRNRLSPRGRRLLRAELTTRGIDRKAADEHLESIDETDAAARAASRKARSLATLDYPAFQRRLGDYLLRRGFSHETARNALRNAWSDLHPDHFPAEDSLDAP
ncbi:MAG: RecX family transcriptional regulator [Chloroflexota bacterium]